MSRCVQPVRSSSDHSALFSLQKDNNNVTFTTKFSRLANSAVSSSNDTTDAPCERPVESDDLARKLSRTCEKVGDSQVAADSQKVLLNLLGRTRDIAELIGSFGGAVGEVRGSFLQQKKGRLKRAIQTLAIFDRKSCYICAQNAGRSKSSIVRA